MLKQIITESKKLKQLITPDVKSLGDIFAKHGHEIRIVGGAVRDAVLGKEPKDIDLATTATPEEMLQVAKAHNLKYIETGLQHGTITVVVNGEPYEITTLRVDVETDGRHAEVEWTTSFEKDAERRDLTFNAMSVDMNGVLHDYFGGVKDLKAGKASFVGNAETRIQEDYLRILRYFRFLGRQATPLADEKTLDVIRENIKGLENISGERIWMELSKILTGRNVGKILNMMRAVGFFELLRLDRTSEFDKAERASRMGAMPITCFCWLVSDLVSAVNPLQRFKVSKNEQMIAHYVLDNQHTNLTRDRTWERYIVLENVPVEHVVELALFTGDSALASKVKQFKIPAFPISGKDLIAQGVKPGPEMGAQLKQLKMQWFENDYEIKRPG